MLGVTLHCTFVYRRSSSIASSVIVDFLLFSPLVLFGMSPKNKAKRKNKCPGCGTPKEQHDFAVMGKNCDGPAEEPDPDCEINQDEKSEQTPGPVPADKQDALLQAIRALSSQVGALQLEQQTLRDTVTKLKDAKTDIGGGTPTQETSACTDNNSAIQPEKQPQTGLNSGSGHPISGTVLKGVQNGAYVDFIDLLPRLKVKQNTCGDITCGTGDRKASATLTIESFDLWLEAWNIYEALLMDVDPAQYKELARYRDVIQKADRKFMWSAVYSYDVQFRLSLTLNKSARFDTIDTTLYTTLLDSSAVRKEGHVCQRCKSPNHLVRDCSFRAKSALEENQGTKKIGPRTRQDSTSQQPYYWKYEKWFASNGTEGCNLFQRNSCQQGAECKRAHICKAFRGDHAMADCKFVTRH